jgi:hypothetical protein
VHRLGANVGPRIAGEKLDERRELRTAPDADERIAGCRRSRG